MIPPFVDFHVMVRRVSGGDDDSFVVSVIDAPDPLQDRKFAWFAAKRNWMELLGETGAKLSHADGRIRLDYRNTTGEPAAEITRKLQRTLFQFMFPEDSDVRRLLQKSCERALFHRRQLRIKLDLDRLVGSLPWEAMAWPVTDVDDAPIRQVSPRLVRYNGDIIEPEERGSGACESRANEVILIVKSDPDGMRHSKLTESFEREKSVAINTINNSPIKLAYELVEGCNTLESIRSTSAKCRNDGRRITGFHFIGHGGLNADDGFLLGENERSERIDIFAEDLERALGLEQPIRWALLNACSTASEPIGCPLAGIATSFSSVGKVPWVVAYRRPVATSDAEKLAKDFYERFLRDGDSIENVVHGVQVRGNPGGLVILTRARKWGKTSHPTPPPQPSASTAPPPTEPPPSPATSPPPTRPSLVEFEWIHVSSGEFQKGLRPDEITAIMKQWATLSIDQASAREILTREHVERKHVPSFKMGKMLVTNAQFRRFVEATGYQTTAELADDKETWSRYDVAGKAHHPVVNVSFSDAQAFCTRAGVRLPKADEWKKAYRGQEGRIYPWGNQFDPKKCNTAENKNCPNTTPVDRFSAYTSPYGCLDMVGNVEEWIDTDGEEDAKDEERTKLVMGGSWCMTCQVYGLPVLHRLARPDFYSNDLGFRCATDV